MKKLLTAFLLLGAVGVKAQQFRAPVFNNEPLACEYKERDTIDVFLQVSYCDSCPVLTVSGYAVRFSYGNYSRYLFFDKNWNRPQFVWQAVNRKYK